MNRVTLLRRYMKTCTPGYIVFESGLTLATLELPWLNNAQDISCFEPGEYLVKYMPRSASGKYTRVWHVQDVPGRTGILFHKGNFLRDTHGCVLVGLKHFVKDGTYAISSSANAFKRMRDELQQEDFILNVVSV